MRGWLRCMGAARKHHAWLRSTEIMRMAAETCLGPGKTLVTASPTFDFIAHAARLVGAEIRSTPLTLHYGHDLNAMLARTDDKCCVSQILPWLPLPPTTW